MKNKRFLRFGTLTLSTVFTLMGIAPSGQTDWTIHPVLAQTADEIIANRACEKGSAAVVTIKNGNGHGSGFLVSQDGLIITNAHVLEGGPSVVTVVFLDGTQVPADVVGFAKGGVDLAAIKIQNRQNLPALAIASSGAAKVGYQVFAIGTPLDPDNRDTCTQGHISRIREDGKIQHNAETNPGNSGGPLLNTQGKVIGVNTAGLEAQVFDRQGNVIGFTPSGTGIYLATPIERVQAFLADVRQQRVSNKSTLPRPSAPPVLSLALNGTSMSGSLDRGDRILSNGSYVDLYEFLGQKGQQITLEMNSPKINPVLVLYQITESPEGQKLLKISENDDKGAGDFNAQIVTTLPADGVYLVFANSLERGETGNYDLRAIPNP